MPQCVCVKHSKKLFNARSGVYAIEYKDAAKTQPYKIWNTDKYVCPVKGCTVQILTGFGNPTCEWESDFKQLLATITADPKAEIINFY